MEIAPLRTPLPKWESQISSIIEIKTAIPLYWLLQPPKYYIIFKVIKFIRLHVNNIINIKKYHFLAQSQLMWLQRLTICLVPIPIHQPLKNIQTVAFTIGPDWKGVVCHLVLHIQMANLWHLR